MKAIKAKTADKPRVVKTWRIKPEVVRTIKRLAKTGGCSESELVEKAVEFIAFWTETHPHVGNAARS